jgi:hypothetical protein
MKLISHKIRQSASVTICWWDFIVKNKNGMQKIKQV